MSLASLGWNDSLAKHLDHDLLPARVIRQERTRWRVLAPDGEHDARATGRLRRDRPVTGDWVVGAPDGLGGWAIHAILPRRGALVRADPGGGEQILAAHVDVVLALAALDQPLNPRRLERALALAGGLETRIVLTKADLGDARAAAEALAPLRTPVISASARTGEGLDALRRLAAPDRTLALVGVSGAGKTTLANALAEARGATGPIRDDGKGRHTTTWRELVPLPTGGALLDAPGLRELGLTDAAIGFEEIDALAAGCRFRDCAHDTEPGCAVRAEVPPDRLAAWRKLQREAAWRAAKRRRSA